MSLRSSRTGKPVTVAATLVLSMLVVMACATTQRSQPGDRPVRELRDVPDHFLVGALVGEAAAEPAPGTGCKNPMVDPRNQLHIRLVHSSEGRGDYEVPSGQYGVGENEVLRIDCATGRAVGVFRRQKGS